MYRITFWKDAGERAVATVAQTLIALIGVDFTGIIDVAGMDWAGVGATAVLAGIVSVLKSLAAGAKDGNASVGSQNRPRLGDTDELGA